MAKIKYVIKRNGETVAFSRSRVVNAIFRAAVSVGGRDKEKAEKEKEAAKAEKEKKADTKDEPKVDDNANDKIAQLEDRITSQDKIQADATKNIEKLKGDLKIAQDNKNTGKSSQAEVDAISAKIQQETEDKKAAKTEEDKLKKQLKSIKKTSSHTFVMSKILKN